jgi:hypothetical protein
MTVQCLGLRRPLLLAAAAGLVEKEPIRRWCRKLQPSHTADGFSAEPLAARLFLHAHGAGRDPCRFRCERHSARVAVTVADA